MKTATIVLATYNRPKEVCDCIDSLLSQTVLPYEILVLDDGNLEEHPREEACKAAGIRYVYHKKKVRGLTESRNVGVKLATGEVLFFFDDDVIVAPDYLELTLKLYEEDPGGDRPIGGVGGVITNNPKWGFKDQMRYLYHRFFLLVGPHEGRALRSGFCADYYLTPNPLKEVTEVEFFSGGVCSYLREVFDQFAFTPGYRAHALGEDKDFSYQVSRHYRLLLNPAARLEHLEAPAERPDKYKEGKMFVMGRYLFFKLCVKKSRWDWFAFFYAHFGYMITRILALLIFPNPNKVNRLRGNFSAYKDIILGQGPKLRHMTPEERDELTEKTEKERASNAK